MKYIKTALLCLITITMPLVCDEEPSLNSETASPAVTTTNELQDWEKHTATLAEHWNATTNAPEDEWVTKAKEVAVPLVTANKELADTLKNSFLDAINQQTTKLSSDTITAVNDFNNAIDTALEAPEEKKEETTAKTTPTSEPVTEAEPQPEQAPTEETPPSPEPSAEPITPSEPTTKEAEKTEPAPEEKQENFIEEWNNCLKNMQTTRGDVYDLMNKAAELAQKIHNQNLMSSAQLIETFGKALQGAVVVRKLPSYYKTEVLNNFANLLGVYIPTPAMPTEYYQPSPSSPAQEEQTQQDIVAMQQKIAEQERAVAFEAERRKIEMAQQAALTLAAEKKLITESQWQKSQISRLEAEQKAQSQAMAQQLAQLTEKKAEQRTTAPAKSLITRAKEAVVGFVLGPTAETIELSPEEKQLLTSMLRQPEQYNAQQKTIKAYTALKEAIIDSTTTVDNKIKNIQRSLITLIEETKLQTKDWLSLTGIELNSNPNLSALDKQIIKKEVEIAISKKSLKELPHSAEQVELAAQKEKNAQIVEEMRQKELIRQQQLKKEQNEIDQFNDAKKLPIQQNEWLGFMQDIRQLESKLARPVTKDDDDKITKQAIEKAESILMLASRVPSAHVRHIEETLKHTFANALIDQQRGKLGGKPEDPNIFKNMHDFNIAINAVVNSTTHLHYQPATHYQ